MDTPGASVTDVANVVAATQPPKAGKVVTNRTGTKSMVAPPKPDLSTPAVRTELEKHTGINPIKIIAPKPVSTGRTGKRAAAAKPAAVKKTPNGVVKTPIKTPEEAKTGNGGTRPGVIANKTQAQIKQEVNDLLRDLQDASDSDEKKKIRRSLRARGHVGGLGPKAKKEKPAPAAKAVAAKK